MRCGKGLGWKETRKNGAPVNIASSLRLLSKSERLLQPGANLEPPAGAGQFGFGSYSPSKVVGVAYSPPPFVTHKPRLLAGTELPPPVLTPQDKPQFSRDAEQAARNMAHSLGGAPSHGRR